ncbi:hypothetical protein RJ640_022099 [Escallonia rubra]|uniref:Uncharacterized protein n=1 Tax=Escallonia rubra TaxID=112253 RepID=A0AA88QUM5_9ASTE|nr:hypothetical protein RJ640_022099 [Escallonia rubra]
MLCRKYLDNSSLHGIENKQALKITKQNILLEIQETLLRVCCAMLVLVRRRLLAGDFTSNLKLLQHYPPTNISHLLYVANKLRAHSAG